MKKIYNFLGLAAFTILGCNMAYALPAKPGLITAQQPDGSEIKIRMEGDAFNKRIYNEAGKLLTVDDRGFYVESTMTEADFEAALERNRVRRSPGLTTKHFPTTGKQKVLIILAEFSNSKFTVDNPKQFFHDMLNKEGFDEYGATGSAYDYFNVNSGGLFQPQFDVYGPVTLSNTDAFYGADDAMGNEANAYQLIIDACRALDSEIDFTQYDVDKDGYIDNVYVYYAGKGQADGGPANTVWPHAGDIYSKMNKEVKLDGVLLDHYACSNEMQNRTGKPDGIGSFCHEFGHVMGLPDLYPTIPGRNIFHPQYWDIMCYGSYNNESRTPPYYSGWERFAFGWTEPEVLTGGEKTLEPLGDSNKVFIIYGDNENDYYILENRQKKGWDEYLQGHGMLVWHIDYHLGSWDTNTVNSSALHQSVDLIEADNILTTQTIDGDPFPGTANITKFTFETTPSLQSWTRKNVGIAINNIEETADGLIKLSVHQYDPAGIEDAVTSQDFISISGNVVTTAENGVNVYDIAGRRVTVLNSESCNLPSGIYIATFGNNHLKFIVK